MAMQENSVDPVPSSHVVGNAFVGQYYQILHHSPELVHRFYQDNSSLSRPDNGGVMTTVTTMQEINSKIVSLNYGDYTAEIVSADAQDSYENGVIVLVTGCLTGKDSLRRKFAQTFFLAPQENGYYVLNDVFRYIEETESGKTDSTSASLSENAPAATEKSEEPEMTWVSNNLDVDSATLDEEEDLSNDPEVFDPLDHKEGSVVEEEVFEPLAESNELQIIAPVDSAPVSQEDAPKKSYASIVKVTKLVSHPVYIATSSIRAAPVKTDNPLLSSVKPESGQDTSAPRNDGAPESSNFSEEAEGHSIYVRNLPFEATVSELEETFKKFGAIKENGVQVRSNKQGFCFGFVEFEQLSSARSALEASSITIGDREVVVEEKRTTARVSGSGKERYYLSVRGGIRSESFRGRGGNYGGGGGRGYGRNEFRNQSDFSGRPRGSTGRGETYQRVDQNGSGRGGGRSAGPNHSSVST